MTRPTEITGLSGTDFVAYYWLKADLIAFCRQNSLPTAGSKVELTERIRRFLESGEVLKPAQTRQGSGGKMPSTFTKETVIGETWRCSQALRAFFEEEIGAAFHFNQFMREFIRENGVGLSLQAAIDGWQRASQVPAGQKEIEPQFEYNRHFRAYFAENAGATRQDAIRAWNEKKSKRRTEKEI